MHFFSDPSLDEIRQELAVGHHGCAVHVLEQFVGLLDDSARVVKMLMLDLTVQYRNHQRVQLITMDEVQGVGVEQFPQFASHGKER